MRILNRYILLESFTYFFISLFAFTGLLFTLRMLKLTSLIINKGVEFSQIVMVFVSIIPTFLEIAIPMSALLGIMLAFARLSGDSEIIVIRASGVSLKQLIRPVLIFGFLCAALCMYVSFKLKPWGYQQLSRSLFEIARSKSTAGLSAGVFNDLGSLTLYAEKIDHYSGDLEGVLIDDRRNQSSRKIITATKGQIESNEEKQTITFNLAYGDIHEIINEKYVLTHYSTNSLILNSDEMYDPNVKQKDKRSREMGSSEIRRNIKHYNKLLIEVAETEDPLIEIDKDSNQLTSKKILKKLSSLHIELGQRWAMPFAAFILALVAMPLGIQPPRTQRTWGASLSVCLGMFVFVVYYGLLSFGIAFAEGGLMNPYLSVWIPNIVATIIAAYTLSKMSSEEWQSIANAFEEIAFFITRTKRPDGES